MTTMSSDGWRWEPGGCRVTELGGLLAASPPGDYWLSLSTAGGGGARDCRLPLDWIGCHRPLLGTDRGRLTSVSSGQVNTGPETVTRPAHRLSLLSLLTKYLPLHFLSCHARKSGGT